MMRLKKRLIKMKEDKKVPNIRFPGFTNDWEQRKLQDMIEVCSGRDYKHLEEGDIPVYGTGGYMLSVSEALSDEQDAIGIGRKGTIDKPFILKAPFWTVDTLFYCVPRKDYDLSFVFDIFQNINWKAMDESTGVPSLSKAVINKVETLAPNYEEQKKIGGYFSKLDTLITLHQRKCDKIKELKLSMLQKMFPRNGEMKPEIRFPEFTDDWEQRKLEDVTSEFKSGSFIAAAEIEETGEYPVYGGNGLRGYSETYNHDGEFALIGRQGALCGNMNYSTGEAYFTEHAVAVKANDLANTKFLYYLLDKMNLGQYSDQSAQPGLAVGKIIKLKNMFPSKEEQDRIGDYFTNFDHLITLHQRKCEELKKIKQSMLQKMFL